jgi:acetylornithine deacetylase
MYKVAESTEDVLYNDAVALLRQLIAIPSFSKEEYATAHLLSSFLMAKGIPAKRLVNNVWAVNKYYDPALPTLLLNSHHDTVRPNKGYTNDPFHAMELDGKLYGLGSNDAGGCLVSLIAVFLHFYEREDMKYNLIIAATAEEEISGVNGIELLLPELGRVDVAIVGEPTQMQMAVAEKGLMVIDCTVDGVSGHAARDEGENALYKAIEDIQWFRNYSFEKVSPLLGPVKMNVTMINAGTQHNVIPGKCSFVVDIRINDEYSHDEILEIISGNVQCAVVPRSKRLRATAIDTAHPLVQAGVRMGLDAFGSATLSDKALMPFPALKIGPGDSARSHVADEFVYLGDIRDGINIYIQLLNDIL